MSCTSCKNKTQTPMTNPFKKDIVIYKKELKKLNDNNLFTIYNKYAINPIEECECIGTRQRMTILLNYFAV